MSIILRAENISKQYRLGTVGTGTLGHDLNRWWHSIRGKEDPYLKVGGVNDRSIKATGDYVWALRDINFEVKRGEVLGIIGKNGAGKSTLLKILSRVTAPTTGIIKTKGRIASLLEVGTGFHGELTGRQNIYMNGAVLGMTKREIRSKIDEIIAFSGCEMYIDTPVKRYSSGMTVRLGFAVAAHLEPEILVIDEVLAVGDAEFQKKAIGKMQDLSQGEGRTVLFVSHNMASVKSLCNRGLLLENGNIKLSGKIDEIINEYLISGEEKSVEFSIEKFIKNQSDDLFILKELKVFQEENNTEHFFTHQEINIQFNYKVLHKIIGLRIGFDLIDLNSGIVIFRSYHDDNFKEIIPIHSGEYNLLTQIPPNFLKEGRYAIKLAISIHNVRWIVHDDHIKWAFIITHLQGINSIYADPRPGVIMPHIPWKSVKLN